MADLAEVLHDEVDEQEALAGQASAIVESAIGELRRIFDEAQGAPIVAMEMLAQLVAIDLDVLTTKAVRTGASAGARRAKGDDLEDIDQQDTND